MKENEATWEAPSWSSCRAELRRPAHLPLAGVSLGGTAAAVRTNRRWLAAPTAGIGAEKAVPRANRDRPGAASTLGRPTTRAGPCARPGCRQPSARGSHAARACLSLARVRPQQPRHSFGVRRRAKGPGAVRTPISLAMVMSRPAPAHVPGHPWATGAVPASDPPCCTQYGCTHLRWAGGVNTRKGGMVKHLPRSEVHSFTRQEDGRAGVASACRSRERVGAQAAAVPSGKEASARHEQDTAAGCTRTCCWPLHPDRADSPVETRHPTASAAALRVPLRRGVAHGGQRAAQGTLGARRCRR